MPILVDSNVLLDVFTEDSDWFDWSSTTLAESAENDLLYINPIIYSEISVGFNRIEELEVKSVSSPLPPMFPDSVVQSVYKQTRRAFNSANKSSLE